jgi:hypothetical protein
MDNSRIRVCYGEHGGKRYEPPSIQKQVPAPSKGGFNFPTTKVVGTLELISGIAVITGYTLRGADLPKSLGMDEHEFKRRVLGKKAKIARFDVYRDGDQLYWLCQNSGPASRPRRVEAACSPSVTQTARPLA